MGKKFRILTGCVLMLFLLTLVPTFFVSAAGTANCPAPEGKGIRVMSFNVLNNNNKDSAGNFIYAAPAKREKEIVSMIKSYMPDIIGMQEAGTGGDSGKLDWCATLNTDLKSIYAYRSLKDDTGLALDVYRGLIIFYNKSRFTLVSSGGQGYSDPANNRRAFHWVKLKDKDTNTEFFVFNTHWQYDGNQTLAQNQATRVTQQAEMAKKINSLAKNHHFFVTGDFNSSYVQKDGSKCDAVAFSKFMQNANYKDGLIEAPEKYTVHANGTRTAIQSSDSGLQTSFDHVVYHGSFYTPLKMEKILCRTYGTKLSDHDAILVHFKYKMPSLTVSATEGNLDAFYSNGAYYIDNFERRTTDLPITVSLSGGAVYTDSACTASAGTSLTMKSGNTQTYRPNNTLYIKWGGMVQTLYLRSCNINTYANAVFVDKSMTDKAPGSTTLYCDKWYGRLVTVGVNGFANIQDAVNAAGNGFDVLVAPGTYSENITVTDKSLKLYGQNRTNLKALVVKNGKLEVNTSGRTYETYLTGNITYNMGSQQTAFLMVNGFHFTGRTSTAQIYLTGGDAGKTLDLRISNNLFNCYTDGAANNGSVVHGISAVQKTGSIEDNYFHLTKIPTYTDSSGKTVNYTNRGITLRNLKDISIIKNYFDGYTGSKMRPFWLSSEVSSGSTTPGNGNVAILGNRFENSYPGALHINNIRGGTTANILIAANSYGGEKMNIDFSQTASQNSQNLPTDKTKISFQVQTNDYPNLSIAPASPGVSAKKFTYYVTFRSEDGMYIYGNTAVSGTTATYKGANPTKAPTSANHYSFKGWMTEKNGTTAANLSSVKANTDVYASFTATAHTVSVRGQQEPTCTAPGATGERYCTVCGHVISANSQIPATGHAEVIDPSLAPTCTQSGLTEGKHCSVCGTVLTAQEVLPAKGHTEVVDKAMAPTCTETGLTEGKHCSVCSEVLTAQEVVPAKGHTEVIDKAVAPTCTETGLTEGKHCSVCNTVLTAQEVVPAKGHTEVTDKAVAPTCTETGLTEGKHCSVCSAVLTAQEVIPAKGHTEVVDKAMAPTCTETGLTEGKHCSVCSTVLTAQEVLPAKGHTEVVDKAIAPTCTETGLTEGKHCSACNTVLIAQEVVPAKGHTEVIDKAVAPTCTETGLTEGKHCSVCSAVLTPQEVIPATGHSYAYEKIDVLTHRVYCSNCDAEEITSHVFIDGSCICGEVEIKDPVLDSSLKLSHSLNLASDISINFVVPAYLLEGYDMSTVYVESTVENYEGETFLGTETVCMEPVEMGSYYYFTLTGITAVQMNDTISTVLYGEKDGQPYYSNTDLYSVAQYAYSQLNKPNSTETLKTLCADLLRYGAKAQIYKEYRISSLADADMTEEHKTYLSDLEAVTFGNNSADLGDLANAPIIWVGKTLDLDSKVCLKFVFNTSNYTGSLADLSLKVTYKDIYGETMEVTVTEVTVYDPARDRYAFSVDALLASELREVVSVQIFQGEKPVSTTFQYSADTYGNNKTGTLLDLCKGLFAYSDSAKTYFAQAFPQM